MGRKQPTDEQKQKAAERRERFKALARQVSEMTPEERMALVMKVGAVITCEGRALSEHNTCLLITQLPTVSMVGGFWQWKDKGRSVRKGAVGLGIWIPTGKRAESASDSQPSSTDLASDSESEGASKSKRRGNFIMGTVFDVSQTEPTEEREAADTSRADYRVAGCVPTTGANSLAVA